MKKTVAAIYLVITWAYTPSRHRGVGRNGGILVPVQDRKKLVFIGGGHAHALVLRALARRPIAGVELTLISDVERAPYSGMLPGLVAGLYTSEEIHIDLPKLAQAANCSFVLNRAVGLNLQDRAVRLQDSTAIPFDGLAIDIGSTPSVSDVSGVNQHAIPVKPVAPFLAAWEDICRDYDGDAALSMVIVGGGAGGVELALAMRRRLGVTPKIHLVFRESAILATHPKAVRTYLEAACQASGILLHSDTQVSEVQKEAVHCACGKTIDANHTFWVTHASPQSWLQQTGLALDAHGFIAVNSSLQSLSHPDVFASGDVATMVDSPRPKAGVYAVRQSVPLTANLRKWAAGKPLVRYVPQDHFLSLINTADHSAVASRGWWSWRSRLLWYLKDFIDRRFMSLFE